MDDSTDIRRTFINTYLDAPIIEADALKMVVALHEVRALGKERIPWNLRNAKKMLDLLDDKSIEIQMYDPHDFKWMFHSLPTRGAKTYISDAHELAKSIYDGCITNLGDKLEVPVLPDVIDAPDSTVRDYINRAELFVRYTDRVAVSRSQGGNSPVKVDFGSHSLIGNQYSAIWVCSGWHIAVVLPYEAVLMFKDMCLARANIYDTIRVVYGSDHEITEMVTRALEWCTTCLAVYGNRGYEVLKNIEPIAKAVVIDREDKTFTGDGALIRLMEVVKEKERKFGADSWYLIDDLLIILQDCAWTGSVIEIFGLMKVTGHPLIDPRVGGKSAAEEAALPRDTLYSDAVTLRNNWRRMYLEGFIRKTGRWPKLTFSPEAKSTRLYQLYSTRERKISRHSYSLADWNYVRFGTHAEFEYYDNYLDLMDDKAISFYLTEFRATWRKNIKPRSHRRLLLEMLTREDISIKRIIRMVEEDQIPADWMIVSLYPKEREFKLSARMFSMMVFEMRVLFACLEANIAEKIFPYLPQQTMTLKKTEIQEKFYSLTKPSLNPEVARLFLEVDLSRWNLRWRDLPIRLIGEDLNDIFGLTRCFTLVHSFFRNCLILVRVANYEPTDLDLSPPPQSDLLWYNHEGGFEGIAQKHWTIATYSMIDLGIKDYDFSYNILGQGDNQIVLAYLDVSNLPDPQLSVKKIAKSVTSDIAKSCARVGQDAKPEECLESTSVITYSKDFFVNGADFFMTIKAFSRIFPRGTSEFPTIINYVGSIGSGCVAASERMKDSSKGYYLMLYHASRYLLSLKTRNCLEASCMTVSTKLKLDPSVVRRLLTLPSSLGGLPLPTFPSFIYKGGADPLAKDLSGVPLLPSRDKLFVERCIYQIIKMRWTRSDHSSESILQDPYSLPISSVALAESRVQKVSLDHVKEAAKANRDIHELVSADVEKFETNLVGVLMKVTPFNPALLADVMDHSIVGVKTMISKMFTSTRTVQELTHGDDSDPGGTILRTSASSFQSILSRVISVPKTRYKVDDVYQTTRDLRDTWTKLKIKPTSKIEGISSYVPLGWTIRTRKRRPEPNEIQIVFTGSEHADMTRGAHDPYLGTDTHEKRTKYGYKIVISSSAERAASRLYSIMTQPGVSEAFEELICQIAETRTDADLSALKLISSKAIGGTIGHRFSSIFDMLTASILGCGTFASHTVLNSDFAGLLSGSTEDYKVFFQEFFAAGIALLNFLFKRGQRDPITLGFIVPDDLEPLDDAETTSTFHLTRPLPAFKENKIAFVQDLRLIRQEKPYSNRLVGEMKGSLDLESPLALARTAAARELRRHSAGYVVSDVHSGTIRMSLDILEYRGIGLDNILDGISLAIADHTYHSLFVRVGTKWRWTAMPLIASLSSAFSHSIVRAASHPLFSKDRVTLEVIMPSEMTYSYYKAAGRVSREIAVRAHKFFVSRPSHASAQKLLLFLDDEESASLEAGITIFRKSLVLGVMAGEISTDEAYEINRKTLLQRLRGTETPQSRLDALYGAALVVLDFARMHHLTELESYLTEFCGSNLLVLVDGTLAESLRLRRRFNMTTSSIPDLIGNPLEDSAAPTPATRSTLLIEDFSGVTKPLVLSRRSGDDLEWATFKYRRSASRVYGLEAPVIHSYWPARNALRARTLLILGSGNGGCAAVAAVMNIERVILHDLQSDIIPEAWSSPRIALPILQRVRTKSYFERSRSGFGESRGNLQHINTWKELSENAPIECCVVYDIEIRTVEELVNVISRVVLHFPGSPFVTRWILDSENLYALLSSLLYCFAEVEVYPVFLTPSGAEVVVRITPRPGESLTPYRGKIDTLSLWSHLCESTGVEQFKGGRDVNWKAEFADLDVDTGSDEHLLSHDGISLVDDAASKSTHGYTYAQWTRVLWYRLAKSVRDSDGEAKESLYLQCLLGSNRCVTIGNKTLSVAATKSFLSFWKSTVPRCT